MELRKKIVFGIFTAILSGAFMFALPASVFAASSLTADTSVYYANSKIYHLKSECGTLNTSTSMALEDALEKGMKMCETCATEAGLTTERAKNLTVEDLPVKITGSVDTSNSSSGTLSEDSTDTGSDSASKSKSAKSSSGSGNASSKATASTSSSSSSSSSSSGGKTLMTEKQRKSRFFSKTNPKRGEKPVTIPRPASAGFEYADFAKFNAYASENGLGMTPIYLLGTIMEIEKVADKGNSYSVVFMVNDCDGYQWYMRTEAAKDKYDLMKSQLLGKAANIYGFYTGYSGVTNRPMMDPTIVLDVNGTSTNLAIYK